MLIDIAYRTKQLQVEHFLKYSMCSTFTRACISSSNTICTESKCSHIHTICTFMSLTNLIGKCNIIPSSRMTHCFGQ